MSAPVTGLGRSLPTAGSERERGQGQGKGRRANSPPVGNNPDRNNTPNHRRINPKSESEPVFKPPGGNNRRKLAGRGLEGRGSPGAGDRKRYPPWCWGQGGAFGGLLGPFGAVGQGPLAAGMAGGYGVPGSWSSSAREWGCGGGSWVLVVRPPSLPPPTTSTPKNFSPVWPVSPVPPADWFAHVTWKWAAMGGKEVVV